MEQGMATEAAAKPKINPMLALVLGVFGISFSSIFVRYSAMPSLATATWRLGWTVALMAPVVLTRHRAELRQVRKKDVLVCAVSGLFLALHFFTWFESLKFTSIASSTVLVSTEVIFTAIGFCVVLKGKIPALGFASIGITMVGSIIIAMGDHGVGSDALYGDVLALLGAVFVAVYTLIGRVQRGHLSTTIYTFLVYASCTAVLLALSFLTRTPLLGYGVQEILIALALGICCTLLGHSVFSWCLKYMSPSFVSAVKLCEPVFATLLAVAIFSEIPSAVQIIGGVVVMGGVFLYSRVETRKQGA